MIVPGGPSLPISSRWVTHLVQVLVHRMIAEPQPGGQRGGRPQGTRLCPAGGCLRARFGSEVQPLGLVPLPGREPGLALAMASSYPGPSVSDVTTGGGLSQLETPEGLGALFCPPSPSSVTQAGTGAVARLSDFTQLFSSCQPQTSGDLAGQGYGPGTRALEGLPCPGEPQEVESPLQRDTASRHRSVCPSFPPLLPRPTSSPPSSSPTKKVTRT